MCFKDFALPAAILLFFALLFSFAQAQTQEDIDAAAQELVNACAAAQDVPSTGLCGTAVVMQPGSALTPEQVASLQTASNKAAQAAALATEASNLIDEVLLEVAPQ